MNYRVVQHTGSGDELQGGPTYGKWRLTTGWSNIREVAMNYRVVQHTGSGDELQGGPTYGKWQ